jgi:hypothetical protein
MMMSSLRSIQRQRARVLWRLAVVLAFVALAALALGGVVDSLQGGALTMLPALALSFMMLTRPYLGERVIARLRSRRPRRQNTAGASASSLRRDTRVARGGRLIAVALAGRAPPLAHAGAR